MSLIKEYLPPIFVRKAISLLYGWSGNFKTWEDAKNKCTGYDSDVIFNKVRDAILKVKSGEAAYERDSVLFDKIHYSFPLLAALSQVALKNTGRLDILDFGGSMGSSYFQNRKMFENITQLNWCVVEQNHFVKEGQKIFADNHLHFYYTVDDCLKEHNINTLLLGSVLQYIEKPYELLEELISKKIEYIIVDRTPLLITGDDRITIQKVPAKIYKAQYPCWLLNESHVLSLFLRKYNLVFEADLPDLINVADAHLKFYFFKLKH
jgi:putative methyltransferase (TIGR04325 family)